jgi:translation initiation factor 1
VASEKKKNHGIVYSTGHGRMCPTCGRPIADCACRRKKDLPGGDGVARVSRETKGRKGKVVTVLTGIPLDEEGLRNLAKELKQKCGTGGTLKDGTLEIQGDHRDTLLKELESRGCRVKRSGG